MGSKKRMSRRLWILALPVMLFVTLFAGCTGTTATNITTPSASPTPKTPMPTVLRIYRISGPPESHAAPFSAQGDQADKVQRLFAAMRALPPFAVDSWCPLDRGGGYFLTFLDHNDIVAQAFIPAGGCAKIALSKPYGCHTRPYSIIQQLADTLGVPTATIGFESTFYDTSPPGSPTAPSVPTTPVLPMSPCH